MKLILPALLAVGLALPSVASASVVRTALIGADDAPLIKIDGKGKGKNKHRGKGRGHDDHYYDSRYDERRAYHQGVRDGRRQAYGDHYQPGFRSDYSRYGRGQYLPPEYRTYVIRDYDRYGYPPPPRGSRYVRVGQDTYLTQIATGLILNAFLGGGY